ncbi:MAG: thioredoxin [Bacteroidota bacterium]|nr:thioredoxin [Bacteroidota bacterium]MDP4232217.1 thioredoxin [Bacteroidota bacterium]MDP4243602.1 thioredoxin [Bacteroidota bacterium]MDP4288746.1 thioredoxin [Bacteroidota bacterium]
MTATSTGPLHLTDASFERDVILSEKPVLVDFTATWCGPCRMIAPIIEDLSKEYEGRAVFGKLDVDENPETSMNFGIRSVPTMLIFKGGKVVEQIIGATGKQNILARLTPHLA